MASSRVAPGRGCAYPARPYSAWHPLTGINMRFSGLLQGQVPEKRRGWLKTVWLRGHSVFLLGGLGPYNSDLGTPKPESRKLSGSVSAP